MPYSDSRRYSHDPKRAHRLVAATAILVCYTLAQPVYGQSTPRPQNSSEPETVASYAGILQQLEQLRELSRQPDAQNLADRMWLHQRIMENVIAGSLQVDATIAQIDFEVSAVNALRSSLPMQGTAK